MDDLINRKLAIDDLKSKDPSQVWDTADIEVWVNALPSAQGYADTAYIERLSDLAFDSGFAMGKASAQRWIPCTERLPAYGEWVLLNEGKHFAIGFLTPTNDGGKGWNINGWYHDVNDWDAWQELPDPWKGENDE